MTYTEPTYSPQESLFTRQLATQHFEEIWEAANRPGILETWATLAAGIDFPFFIIMDKRRWLSFRHWRIPHANGIRLDPKAFKYAIRKGGLMGCELVPVNDINGDISHYYVAYRKRQPSAPKPMAVPSNDPLPNCAAAPDLPLPPTG